MRITTASRRVLARVCVVALLTSALATASVGVASAQQPPTVTIGALFDLSGDGRTLGEASKAALEVAAADIERRSEGVRIELDVRDTGQDPAKAVAEFQSLVDDDVRIIIGPQTSSEARAIVEAGLDQSGAILVSNGSTASLLSQPDDALIRLVPDDRVEGAASADLILEQGADTVVVAHREDPGNDGLASSTTAAITDQGGTAVAGPTYPPDSTDAAGVATALSASVSDAGRYPAVYLAGFAEVADILAAAADQPALEGLRFYGGDGSAKSEAIIDDPAAAEFAARAGGFISPLLTVPADAARAGRKTIQKIERRSGQPADAFSLAAYDALWIARDAIESAGASAQGADLRDAYVAAAQGFDGLTGTIELNAAGDRATGPFAYWAVCKTGRGYAWKTVGTWEPPTSPGSPGTVSVTSCKKATTD